MNLYCCHDGQQNTYTQQIGKLIPAECVFFSLVLLD